MNIHDIQGLIANELPDAQLEIQGQGCNLGIRVVSAAFEGLSPVKRQQKVLGALTTKLATGELHAVTLKVYTPAEWEVEHARNSMFQKG